MSYSDRNILEDIYVDLQQLILDNFRMINVTILINVFSESGPVLLLMIREIISAARFFFTQTATCFVKIYMILIFCLLQFSPFGILLTY